MEKGWIFTTGEVVFLGGYLYFALSTAKSVLDDMEQEQQSVSGETKKWGAGAIACLVGLVGLRVWEMADAWMLPSHYKVSKSPFELSPLYSMNSQGQADFGLSLKYKF